MVTRTKSTELARFVCVCLFSCPTSPLPLQIGSAIFIVGVIEVCYLYLWQLSLP